MATGIIVGATTAGLWGDNILTDGGPLDPELNRTWRAGNTPYVLKVGDTEIPLNRLGVAGEVMMYTADMARAMAAIPATLEIRAGDPNSTAPELALEAATKLAALHTALVGNDMLYDDVQRLLRAALTGDAAAARQVMEQRAGAVVPFSAFNKDIRDYIHKERHTADGFLGSLMKALPFGTVDGMSTARNGWGDKTADFEGMNPLSVAIGFTQKTAPRAENKNYVADKLVESEISLLGPGRIFSEEGALVKLTMGEWNALKQAFGNVKLPSREKFTGTYFADEAMRFIVDSKGWAVGTPGSQGSRGVLADQTIEGYRKAAKEWLISGRSMPEIGLSAPSPYALDLQARIQERAQYKQGVPQEPDFLGADTIRRFSLGGTQ
jgi:hypothetical protein